MNDLPETKTVIEWLFGAFVAVLTWIGRFQIKRIDRLEQHYMPRVEVERLHEENRQRLDEIRETVGRTEARMDQLYRDLMKQ